MHEIGELVLVAVDEPMALAWDAVARDRRGVHVHRGPVTDLAVDAVISPANSFGWMRGGIDAVYAQWFPGIEQRVQQHTRDSYGGELPVGRAVAVATGLEVPAWLISAPTMRRPGERLDPSGAAAYQAAVAVFRLWRAGTLPDGRLVRSAVKSMAMPGLGTGVGGLDPSVCGSQIAAALDDVLG